MQPLSLATGTSYFRSPGAATAAAISSLQAGHTYYGPTEGTLALRQAIAGRYEGVQPGQVLITPGTRQALYSLFTLLLREGDEVVVPTPAWFGFQELLKYSKGKGVALQTHMEDGYALTPDMLRQTLTSRSRILVLTNPGNPTGRLYSKAELEALLAVTSEFPDLYVVSDEIYDFITYGEPFTSVLSCQGAQAERTIVVNGFSKTFAMSGWRLGYMVGPEPLVQQCTHFQGSTLAGVGIFLQDAALAALKHRKAVLPEMVEALQEHRALMQQGLDAIPHVRYFLPQGAYYFFPDFSAYIGRKTPAGNPLPDSRSLFAYLQQEAQLELAPGDNFAAPGHARLSFAVEKPVLQEALARLQQALKVLQ